MFYVIAVSLTILSPSNGEEPETIIAPQHLMSQEECQEWKANVDSMPPTLVDEVSGKKVLLEVNKCTLLSDAAFQDWIEASKTVEPFTVGD